MFTSRRFWILILDTVASVAIHYYGGAETEFLIASLQPLFLMAIYSYTQEGTARIREGLDWKDQQPKG